MALSETQLAGLKKSTTPITDTDLARILVALGLRVVPTNDPETTPYTMKINAVWTANAHAAALTLDRNKRTWRVQFFVTRTADGARMGPVHRIENANILQRKGAAVMSELFVSVDDLAPFTCAECGTGRLTWDDNVGSRTIKAGMVCGGCGWRGHTGAWIPFRDLR